MIAEKEPQSNDWSRVLKQPYLEYLYVFKKVPYYEVTMMLHETQMPCIPSDENIETTYNTCVYEKVQALPVTINSVTTWTILVST